MNIEDEKQAIKDIMSLLPTGYIKYIPFDTSKDISFEFKGVTVKMSAIYLNDYLNCYMFDLAWSSSTRICGIPIRCGVDILRQYKTPLPNMYASNKYHPGEDVSSWRQLQLFVIDESVLENG